MSEEDDYHADAEKKIMLHYARLERVRTRSYITYKLPGPGLPNLQQVEKLIRRIMPGWKVIQVREKEN